jgi:23S rRNA pseudouridine1911/1915/1917 synthase
MDSRMTRDARTLRAEAGAGDARLAGITIIAEERHFLVAHKPPNMPAQADSSHDQDMLSILKAYIKWRDKKPGNVYLALLHRLDRPAQGLLVFAKTSKAAARLNAGQRDRKWEKEYLAIVRGDIRRFCLPGPPACPATLEEPPWQAWTDWLIKDERTHSSNVVPVGTPGAKEARLSWAFAGLCDGRSMSAGASSADGPLSMVRIRLDTGRSHQIRVQFSSRGFPLWGDLRYDPAQNEPGMQLALLAAKLRFPHPITGECCSYAACLPQGKFWNFFGQHAALAYPATEITIST